MQYGCRYRYNFENYINQATLGGIPPIMLGVLSSGNIWADANAWVDVNTWID